MARYCTLCDVSSSSYSGPHGVALALFEDDPKGPPLTSAEVRAAMLDPAARGACAPRGTPWLRQENARCALVTTVAPTKTLTIAPSTTLPLICAPSEDRVLVGRTPLELWTRCDQPFKFMGDCADCPLVRTPECAARYGDEPWHLLLDRYVANDEDDDAPGMYRHVAQEAAHGVNDALKGRTIAGFTYVSPGVLHSRPYRSLLRSLGGLCLTDVAGSRREASDRAKRGACLRSYARTVCTKCRLYVQGVSCAARRYCQGPIGYDDRVVARALCASLLQPLLDRTGLAEWQLWVLARRSGARAQQYLEPDDRARHTVVLGPPSGRGSWAPREGRYKTAPITSWIADGIHRGNEWRRLSYADAVTVFGLPRSAAGAGALGRPPRDVNLRALYLLMLTHPVTYASSYGWGHHASYEQATLHLRDRSVNQSCTRAGYVVGVHEVTCYSTDLTRAMRERVWHINDMLIPRCGPPYVNIRR